MQIKLFKCKCYTIEDFFNRDILSYSTLLTDVNSFMYSVCSPRGVLFERVNYNTRFPGSIPGTVKIIKIITVLLSEFL